MTPNNFKTRRLALGLSQTSLAELMGTTPVTISNYETGLKKIPKSKQRLFEYIEKDLRDDI